MEIESQTYEQAMLNQAQRQTKAVELLSTLAQVWTLLAVLGFVTWLFVALAS